MHCWHKFLNSANSLLCLSTSVDSWQLTYCILHIPVIFFISFNFFQHKINSRCHRCFKFLDKCWHNLQYGIIAAHDRQMVALGNRQACCAVQSGCARFLVFLLFSIINNFTHKLRVFLGVNSSSMTIFHSICKLFPHKLAQSKGVLLKLLCCALSLVLNGNHSCTSAHDSRQSHKSFFLRAMFQTSNNYHISVLMCSNLNE